jgi:hypothetical protein
MAQEYTEKQIRGRFGRLAAQQIDAWHPTLAYDFVQDLKQEAWVHILAHETPDLFVARNVVQAMKTYVHRWVFQSQSLMGKGLKRIAEGETDASWLSQRSSNPEDQAMARDELQHVWARLSPMERRAVECVALSDCNEQGQIPETEAQKFGFTSSHALNSRLYDLRHRVSHTAKLRAKKAAKVRS